MTTTPDAPPAFEARVEVAPGDINRVCPGCGTGEPHAPDGDPRCIVVGASLRSEVATLSDGQRVPVQVPVDVAYHFDCHAALGCHVCQALLEANAGSVKGKAGEDSGGNGTLEVPPELVTVEPGEFVVGQDGVLTRAATKEQAIARREAADAAAGLDIVPVDEADSLHAAHAAGDLDIVQGA